MNDTVNDTVHEQHPIGIFLKVWLLLFVLSVFSYLVDFYELQGYWRWSLILIFMVLKAAIIMSVFMHVMWERFALQFIVIAPVVAVLVFMILMAIEADYIQLSRFTYLSSDRGG